MHRGLASSELFRNLKEEQIGRLLQIAKLQKTSFARGEVIFEEGEECEAIGLILSGRVAVKNVYASGREVTLIELEEGDVFGEALLFGTERNLPATVEVISDCEILFIRREDLVGGLFFHPIVFENFMKLLSDKIYLLNKRLRLLSQDSIEKKIAMYLLSFGCDDIEINMTREAMAVFLAVQRPSLSRELSRLRKLGIIDFKKNRFKILKRFHLEDCLD